MLAFKPLWHEGVLLTPQHFQQQEAWLLHASQKIAGLAAVEPWGIYNVQIDGQALEAGRLKLTQLQARLPDGALFDSTVSDRLPAARDLGNGLPDGCQSAVVFAALPLAHADGSNCHLDDPAPSRPQRYYREFCQVVDMHGSESLELAVERQALRLLFDTESLADYVTCPVARLVRDARGRFVVDETFVPPCILLTASARHLDRLSRLTDILAAKCVVLGTRRSERSDRVVEFGVADISLFWLLHSLHAFWPRLAFFASHPAQPPERLYQALAELAGALMTFSTGHAVTSIPPYDHLHQEPVFAWLEATIRELLDTIIPSRVIPIGMGPNGPSMWNGHFHDERLLDSADFYLSVSSPLPAMQVLDLIPRLCKIGSPDDVAHIVNSALTGVPVSPVQRVPSAMPVRLDNHYFVLDTTHAAHARMLASRACQIYVPASIPDASIELYAVLRA